MAHGGEWLPMTNSASSTIAGASSTSASPSGTAPRLPVIDRSLITNRLASSRLPLKTGDEVVALMRCSLCRNEWFTPATIIVPDGAIAAHRPHCYCGTKGHWSEIV